MNRAGGVFLLLAALFASPARADLNGDVHLMIDAWSKEGTVSHLRPRLYERGEGVPLALPAEATDPTTRHCATVLVLGVPTLTFMVRTLPSPLEGPGEGTWPERSVAGVAQLVRCGPAKEALSRLVIELRSPRGVVETLVGIGNEPMSSYEQALTHRAPGPHADAPSPGTPEPEALAPRARRLADWYRKRGARSVSHELLEADEDGKGTLLLELAPGCHELIFLGVPAPRGAPRPVDIDVELLWYPGGELAATDQAEAADARVQVCAARTEVAAVRHFGSLPRAPLLFLHVEEGLPAGLPLAWGDQPRALMGRVLRQYQVSGFAHSPVLESLGVRGVTAIPVEVNPGACYVGGLIAVQGQPTALALAALVGPHSARNHGGPGGNGTLVAFCTETASRALLEIEAHGRDLVWLMALWPSGRLPLGRPAE